jgi:hypothetical protein
MKVLQIVFFLSRAAAMIIGIKRLFEMSVTENEVYFGSIEIMTLAGILMALSLLVHLSLCHSSAAKC